MYLDFTIYPRDSKAHGKIYYVRFRNPDTGERLSGISSKCNTIKGANKWAIKQLQSGISTQKSNLNFSNFTKDWFIWGKCDYIKLMLSKGNRFSRSHADNRRGFLLNHLQPYFGKMKLSEITVQSIESFIVNMQKANYSSSTINSAFSTLSSILKEAHRQGIIKENPILKVQSVVKKSKKKDIIPHSIAQKLLLPENMGIYWDNNPFHYLFNLVAFTTGLRQAEILALRRIDIKNDYLTITHTWDRKYGLKRPKYESERIIPLPDFTLIQISQYLLGMESKDPEALLFSQESNLYKAIDHKKINAAFSNALSKTDLDLDKLTITFHSWRHTFNTLMRGNISDEKLRKITGHKSDKMTDHYTHYDISNYEDVRLEQNKLLA